MFAQATMGFEASVDPFTVKEDGDIQLPQKTFYVGQKVVATPDPRRFIVICDQEQLVEHPPQEGYLMGASKGSRTMLQRRRDALEKVRMGKTPLVALHTLLQKGTAPAYQRRINKALTGETVRKVLGSRERSFTERQREAIDIALNTPDIAIIQGPPGTGKTSVIRAIISRIGEIDPGAKVLISSTQHDAVDNAVEGISCGGLPVHRLGSRRGNNADEQSAHMWQWVEQTRTKCQAIIDRMELSTVRSQTRKALLYMDQCRRQRELSEKTIEYLTDIYRCVVALIPPELCDRIGKLIVAIRDSLHSGKASPAQEQDSADRKIRERLHALIASQRFEAEPFLDDGIMQALRLRSFLSKYFQDVSVPEELLIASEWVHGDRENLERFLPCFQAAMEVFAQKIDSDSSNAEQTLRTNLFDEMERLFQQLAQALGEAMKEHGDSVGDVLVEFMEELEDPENVQRILERYSPVFAATCQQVVAKRYQPAEPTVYDYVIIDEAARSNPLDLLIPMSIGRKIILVGDQKQLPHMLEKEIVDAYLKHHGTPLIRELLQKTLFERLYDQLKETEQNEGIKRVVTLTDQFRMHPTIGRFVSRTFYESRLQSPIEAEQKAHALPVYQGKPIAWIDLPFSLGGELVSSTHSCYRKAEIDRILREVKRIREYNDEYTIGIITFYKEQAARLQNEIQEFPMIWRKNIMVGSVDAFQGREFDIVFLSTVRSNRQEKKEKRVGFLESPNRLCVAFSRAKRLLVVVGDSETVAGPPGQPVIPAFRDFYELCVNEGYYEKP
jgi:hypothetical protein